MLRKHIGQENYGRVNVDEHGEECRMDIDGERCSTKVGCEMMESPLDTMSMADMFRMSMDVMMVAYAEGNFEEAYEERDKLVEIVRKATGGQ